MPKSFSDIMAQIERLQAQANRLNKTRAKAISKANGLIQEFEIKPDELAFASKRRANGRAVAEKAAPQRKRRGPNKGVKVAPKYRGPRRGETWAGRGLMPVWLREAIKKGKKKEDFLIKRK